MNVAISFNPGERWNGSQEIVEFSAEYNGKRVLCAVSLEALCDNFGGDAKEPVQCLRENRGDIEALATKLIQPQRFEADGSILIRSSSDR